ncbi:MAG: helix-turn-helix domain-containing protein [Candidatus Helarchaeota archaeon]
MHKKKKRENPQAVTSRSAIKKMCESFERQFIIDVLILVDWRKDKAAEILGMDRTTLFRKMKKYGIKKEVMLLDKKKKTTELKIYNKGGNGEIKSILNNIHHHILFASL